MLKVGVPELPELEKMQSSIGMIWAKKQVTNYGDCHNNLELGLKRYFNDNEVILFSSGTVALEALLSVIELHGEVVTTGFSFAATAASIIRSYYAPKFSDVCLTDGNLNIENLNHPQTNKAKIIMPVHVYGHACATSKIANLAEKNNWSVIYDAAHTFGSKYLNKHLAEFGFASVLSFHATKIFNTIEGGAVITTDECLASCLREYRSFGFDQKKAFKRKISTNGKMSELHAAVGLHQLENIADIVKSRRDLYHEYHNQLVNFSEIELFHPLNYEAVNGSYMPIVVKDGKQKRDELSDFLKTKGIFARAYFDLNLRDLYDPSDEVDLQNTDFLTNSVLCLPIHSKLGVRDVKYICDAIKDFCFA